MASGTKDSTLLQCYFKTVTGRTISITMVSTASIHDIRCEVGKALGVKGSEVKLIMCGKALTCQYPDHYMVESQQYEAAYAKIVPDHMCCDRWEGKALDAPTPEVAQAMMSEEPITQATPPLTTAVPPCRSIIRIGVSLLVLSFIVFIVEYIMLDYKDYSPPSYYMTKVAKGSAWTWNKLGVLSGYIVGWLSTLLEYLDTKKVRLVCKQLSDPIIKWMFSPLDWFKGVWATINHLAYPIGVIIGAVLLVIIIGWLNDRYKLWYKFKVTRIGRPVGVWLDIQVAEVLACLKAIDAHPGAIQKIADAEESKVASRKKKHDKNN